jgi:hypothetical protein
MKKIISILILVVLSTTAMNAQEKQSNISKFLNRQNLNQQKALGTDVDSSAQWPATLYYNTKYTASLLGSSTIPITFSRLEFKDGDYKLGSSLSLGYGYTWFLGDFVFNESDMIIIDPQFFFGLAADIGLKNDFNSGKVTGSFVTGGFVGFKSISLFGGYDFLAKSWTMGLGARIDLYTISQISFKPYGKVKTVRTPKPGAIPIVM